MAISILYLKVSEENCIKCFPFTRLPTINHELKLGANHATDDLSLSKCQSEHMSLHENLGFHVLKLMVGVHLTSKMSILLSKITIEIQEKVSTGFVNDEIPRKFKFISIWSLNLVKRFCAFIMFVHIYCPVGCIW